jgi:hypothetical protein
MWDFCSHSGYRLAGWEGMMVVDVAVYGGDEVLWEKMQRCRRGWWWRHWVSSNHRENETSISFTTICQTLLNKSKDPRTVAH